MLLSKKDKMLSINTSVDKFNRMLTDTKAFQLLQEKEMLLSFQVHNLHVQQMSNFNLVQHTQVLEATNYFN